MRQVYRTALTLAALGMASAANASDDAQTWTGAIAVVDVGEKIRLSGETFARFSNNRRGLYELESTATIGYRLDHRLTVWIGYTHDPNYVGGDFTAMEHRAREQVTWDNVPLGPGRLNSRLRLEQRWREGVGGPAAWRLRPWARYFLPISKGSGTGFVLSHESFIDLNTNRFQRIEGEERMRNFIGVATPLVKHVTAELGYLNQHSFVPHTADNNDHVASLTLIAGF